MANHRTCRRPVGLRADAREGARSDDERVGGRWLQRVLFATGASLFVLSLAVLTGVGPLAPLGPVADTGDDLDESTPQPAETAVSTATATSAPTPTGTPTRTTSRPTTNASSPSATSTTQNPFAGIGEDSPTTAGGTRTTTSTPTGTPTSTPTEEDDDGIFG